VKVTTKDQGTIPQAIRERLWIPPGAEVEFGVEGKVAKMKLVSNVGNGAARVSKRLKGRKIIGRLRGRGTVRMSTDEIMALTRGA